MTNESGRASVSESARFYNRSHTGVSPAVQGAKKMKDHQLTPGTPTASPETAAAGSTAKVLLVVDDEFLIRWSLRNRLVAAGYIIVEAATAAEARTAFARGVDLVLLDVLLPDGNGMDLLKEFHERRPDSRIILISAHGTSEVADKARAQGAYDFIHKPFDLNVITAVVDRAAQSG